MLEVSHLIGFGSGGGPPPSYTYNTRSINTANQTDYTFTNLNIGTADVTRFVVIGVIAQGNDITGLTIGGSAATRLAHQYVASGFMEPLAFYGLLVPSGTTATVVVSVASSSNCAVVSYSLYNLDSTTPFDNKNAAHSSGVITLSANTTPDAVVLGLAVEWGSTLRTFTWAGVTEQSGFDEVVEASNSAWSGGDALMTSAETPRTITATLSGSPQSGAGGVLIVMR